MQTNIQKLFKNALNKSQITKRDLLRLTKRARNLASAVKPVQAFTHDLEMHYQFIRNGKQNIPISTIVNDIHSLQNTISLYDTNKDIFDDIFCSTKQISMNAYCISIPHHGISGFVDIENTPYFQIDYKSIHQKYANIAQVNKADLDTLNAFVDTEKDSLSGIYVLLKLYAHIFKGKRVQIYCDDLSVINMLNEYEAKQSKPHLQSVITKIAKICMEYKVNACWSRIGGVPLVTADRLARFVEDPFQYSTFNAQSKGDTMGLVHLNELIDEENDSD